MTLWQPWSLTELVADLAAGCTTADAALRRSRERIAATEPRVRAWVEHGGGALTPQVTADAAGTADTDPPRPVRGPLAGVPFGVKDIIDVAGRPTRCGSALRADARPAAQDAAIVRAWREAGAVVAGKTVTTEFAFFAPGPTRNPAALEPEHTPGGSSSGSAAAVACGQVPLAIGSQTAGSVTRPAAYCGVASLVMTHGRFPTDGVVGLGPSLDSHGLYAARTADLALAWRALTGEDASGQVGTRAGTGSAPRILVWSAAAVGGVSDAMRQALDTARGRLTAAGATVDELPEPAERLVAELTAAHPVIMAYEAARERAAELARADRLSAPLSALLRTGTATPREEYEAALRTVEAGRARVSALLTSYDVVLGPAAPGAAPAGLDATGDPVLSRAWQALGLPAVTVPGLRDEAGLPLGLQAIGPARGEARLLARGTWIEDALR
ncbi:amidase [Streptomyces sp. ODS28]|uniref:amidase n=1 Tax=Streptomyces sp. ODS28 TaxID=3136688 RepID=UPI0031ED02C5